MRWTLSVEIEADSLEEALSRISALPDDFAPDSIPDYLNAYFLASAFPLPGCKTPVSIQIQRRIEGVDPEPDPEPEPKPEPVQDPLLPPPSDAD